MKNDLIACVIIGWCLALATSQLIDFECETGEDVGYCLYKTYPHPDGICCKYVQCNSSCLAWEMTCDTVSGYDDLYKHYSADLQRCVIPDATTCTGKNDTTCNTGWSTEEVEHFTSETSAMSDVTTWDTGSTVTSSVIESTIISSTVRTSDTTTAQTITSTPTPTIGPNPPPPLL